MLYSGSFQGGDCSSTAAGDFLAPYPELPYLVSLASKVGRYLLFLHPPIHPFPSRLHTSFASSRQPSNSFLPSFFLSFLLFLFVKKRKEIRKRQRERAEQKERGAERKKERTSLASFSYLVTWTLYTYMGVLYRRKEGPEGNCALGDTSILGSWQGGVSVEMGWDGTD